MIEPTCRGPPPPATWPTTSAMAPYVVTRPRGTCSTQVSTSSTYSSGSTPFSDPGSAPGNNRSAARIATRTPASPAAPDAGRLWLTVDGGVGHRPRHPARPGNTGDAADRPPPQGRRVRGCGARARTPATVAARCAASSAAAAIQRPRDAADRSGAHRPPDEHRPPGGTVPSGGVSDRSAKPSAPSARVKQHQPPHGRATRRNRSQHPDDGPEQHHGPQQPLPKRPVPHLRHRNTSPAAAGRGGRAGASPRRGPGSAPGHDRDSRGRATGRAAAHGRVAATATPARRPPRRCPPTSRHHPARQGVDHDQRQPPPGQQGDGGGHRVGEHRREHDDDGPAGQPEGGCSRPKVRGSPGPTVEQPAEQHPQVPLARAVPDPLRASARSPAARPGRRAGRGARRAPRPPGPSRPGCSPRHRRPPRPWSASASTTSSTPASSSARAVTTCRSPVRSETRQLIRRSRSPAWNGRIAANSVPAPTAASGARRPGRWLRDLGGES